MTGAWLGYAFAVFAAFGTAVFSVAIWRALSTGTVSGKRAYNGEPVSRRNTPIVFWLHLLKWIGMIGVLCWVAGYLLKWWEL
jgi:Trk-type K+ transport system membrane component